VLEDYPAGEAFITKKDIYEADSVANLYAEKGIPISEDYVVQMEVDDHGFEYHYRWWRIQ
jgi:hypothetical protein